MPIGKDSIKKRVAKVAEPAAEVVAEPKKPATTAKKPAAPKAATTAKKPAAPKTATTAKKPTAPKKPAAPKAEAPKVEKPATAVLANVAPETVAAVIGHAEEKPVAKVQLGGKLPIHLL